MTLNKTGIFGGTFNPIHKGHTRLAQEVYNDFALDRMYFVPSKIPPHKNLGPASPKQRFEMVKIAVEDLMGNFEVSDYEISKKGTSYTYLTLKFFRKLYPDDVLFFITGSDIFATIETWNNWNKLFELSNFIVVNRPEVTFQDMLKKIPKELNNIIRDINDFENTAAGRIILHKIPETRISSTAIRDDFQFDQIKGYLSKGVIEYIIKNKLYQEA